MLCSNDGPFCVPFSEIGFFLAFLEVPIKESHAKDFVGVPSTIIWLAEFSACPVLLVIRPRFLSVISRAASKPEN